MKNQILVVMLFSFTFFSNSSFAQWVQTSGPTSSSISCFARSGSNLFVGTAGDGIFLSTNNGTTWKAVNHGLIYLNPDAYWNMNIKAIAASGNNVFVLFNYNDDLGAHHSLFLSTNNGDDWIEVTKGVSVNGIIAIAVSGLHIFVCNSKGIYLSTNNGTNWTAMTNELTGKEILSFAVNDNGVGDTNIYAGTLNDGIFISTNNGVSWKNLCLHDSQGWPPMDLVVNGSNMLVNSGNNGVMFSSNGGANWQRSTPNANLFSSAISVALFPNGTNGINLIAGYRVDGLFLSTDGGISWSQINTGLKNLEIHAVFIDSNEDGSSNIFAGTSGGVYISSNNGLNWTQINRGLTYQYVNALAVNGTNLYAGTGTPGLFTSSDNGTNWTLLTFNNYPIVSVLTTDDNKIFYGTRGGGGYYSEDNGNSWAPPWQKYAGNEYVYSFASFPNGTGGINIIAADYIPNYNIMKLSSDYGKTWEEVNNGLDSTAHFYSIVTEGSKIYASNDWYGVYLSTNNGSNWTKKINGLTNTEIWALAVNGSDLYAGTAGSGVFHSTNDGDNWTAINNGLTYQIIGALAVRNDTVFAGTYNGGVFKSTNRGTTWSAFSNGLTYDSINALVINGNTLYAGTVGGGVWKRSILDQDIEASVQQGKNKIPKQFKLEQNYPNPFNPVTTINYSIPQTCFVTLRIYDLIGKELTTLINEEKPAGSYHVQFNAANLSSGVYFYRMHASTSSASDFVETKKLILLK